MAQDINFHLFCEWPKNGDIFKDSFNVYGINEHAETWQLVKLGTKKPSDEAISKIVGWTYISEPVEETTEK